MTTLLSVWPGTDAELLDKLLIFYPNSPPRKILDAMCNRRRMWKGSKFAGLVTGMDIDEAVKPDIVGDATTMSAIDDGAWDVVALDPPHYPNGGRGRKDFQERFGVGLTAGKELNYSVSHLYEPILKQCKRVLIPGGLVLAKIADYVHNHRFQWAVFDFVAAVRAAGMTPCDRIVKVRKGPIMDPKWKNRHHARRCNVDWVVVRNGECCERR
jgi:hypothetical protein